MSKPTTPKTGISAPHQPSIQSRAEVSALTSFGNTQEDIAAHIGICVDTLYKYYKDELQNSVMRANAKVANKLYRRAVEGDDLSAQIFWLKTRARWRDRESYDERFGSNSQVDDDCKKRMAEMDLKNRKEY
jgi:predicted transcriptional regulator